MLLVSVDSSGSLYHSVPHCCIWIARHLVNVFEASEREEREKGGSETRLPSFSSSSPRSSSEQDQLSQGHFKRGGLVRPRTRITRGNVCETPSRKREIYDIFKNLRSRRQIHQFKLLAGDSQYKVKEDVRYNPNTRISEPKTNQNKAEVQISNAKNLYLVLSLFSPL